MRVYQKLRANNDVNGNPRKLVVVYEKTPDYDFLVAVKVIKYSYSSPDYDPEGLRPWGMEVGQELDITGREYRDTVRQAKFNKTLETLS